jgi:hypothetical protein
VDAKSEKRLVVDLDRNCGSPDYARRDEVRALAQQAGAQQRDHLPVDGGDAQLRGFSDGVARDRAVCSGGAEHRGCRAVGEAQGRCDDVVTGPQCSRGTCGRGGGALMGGGAVHGWSFGSSVGGRGHA